MAKQLITIGTPGAGGGDPAHAAFKKINDNTNEVYSFLGADGSGVLTDEGAREALGVYSKDEVYLRDEVYSKDEANDLIENADFASLETNTFNGHQTMNAGASVTGDFIVNGVKVFGDGLVAQQKKGQRLREATYTNPLSVPLFVCIRIESQSQGLAGTRMGFYITTPQGVDGMVWQAWELNARGTGFTTMVPPNHRYRLALISGGVPADFSIEEWWEYTV